MQKLPTYQSHKSIQAFKIADIMPTTDAGAFLLSGDDLATFRKVDTIYMTKHAPVVGGYFVLYEDGYESFSPAEAFEAGYTVIIDQTPSPSTADTPAQPDAPQRDNAPAPDANGPAAD